MKTLNVDTNPFKNRMLKKIKSKFTEHPQSVNESYAQHFFHASRYGLKMMVAGVATIIHSILPFIFQTTGSDCAREIVANIKERTKRIED